MDAVKYLKEQKRMCANYNYCNECPFVEKMEGDGFDYCTAWQRLYPAEAVRIVEEWSKAHPIQTNGMKLKKDFSLSEVEKVFNAGHWMYALPEQWWNAPYEAPKGDNNG